MPEVNQVSNLIAPSGQGMVIPPDVRQRMLVAQLAQQQAAAPAPPYNSRMAGLAKAIEGGLGGLMGGSAVNDLMNGQRQAGADDQAFFGAAQRARMLANAVASYQSSATMPAASSGTAGYDPRATEALIRSRAPSFGVDPDTAVKIARSEGLGKYVGDDGSSYGPFQLHYGGVAPGGNSVGGLGDAFTKATGLDARDPSTVPQQVDFALQNASQNGWGAWHGRNAPGVNVGVWDGISRSADMPAPNAQPVASSSLPPGVTPDMVSGDAPPQDTSIRGLLSAAFDADGAKAGPAVVPPPEVADNAQAPSPATGPQSDAAMGNAGPPATPAGTLALAAALSGPSAGGGPAAATPGAQPAPSSVPADPAGAMSGFAPSDAAPAAEPSLRDALRAALDRAFADPADMTVKGALAPSVSSAPSAGTGGSAPLPTLLGSNVPAPNMSAPSASPAGAAGGSAANVPLPPSRPSDATLGLNPDAPAPNAVPAGPAPIASASQLADALDAWPPGGNAPAGNSPASDPSSPQSFMRQQALAAALGGQPLAAPPAPGAGTPSSAPPQNGNGLLASIPLIGGQSARPGMSAQAGAASGAPSAMAIPTAAAPALQGSPQTATGGPTSDLRALAARIMNDPYQTPEMKQAVLQRLYPTPQTMTMQNGDLIQVDPSGMTPPRLLAHGGKFSSSRNGVIFNEGTGLAPGQGSDDTSAAASPNFRPATAAERASYGVNDGRPMFIGPGGEPRFGEPQPAGQGESEEAKKAGEGAAARRGDMLAAADAAPEKIARFSMLGKVLDATQTGPLAGEAGTAAAIGQRLGISPERMQQLGIDPNQAVNVAVANKLAGEMTMSSIGAKNGGMPASNFSVAERQFIEGLYPNIENQPGANRAVTDVLTAIEQRKLQIADAWSTYKDQQRQSGQPLSYEDFEDSFRRAHAQDNIFAPIIQKYQAGGYTPNVPGAGGASVPQPQAPQGGPPTASVAAPQGQGVPRPQGASPAAPAPQDALAQAQQAIARGAPRAAVMQRLQSLGINPAGL